MVCDDGRLWLITKRIEVDDALEMAEQIEV
jgi:hypothetical protein